MYHSLRGISIDFTVVRRKRTITTSTKVHIVRRDHIGNDGLGTVRTRVVMLLKHLSNGGRRVQDDDRLVEDLEGEDVAEFLSCDSSR